MRVLLAIDESSFGEAAIQAVLSQFPPSSTEVRVFHALDWEKALPSAYLFAQGSAAARDIVAVRDRMSRDASTLVEKVAARLRAAGFDARASAVREGDPRAAILDEAAEWHAQLIVMGSHGRTGIERFLLGSVSEHVVRHAPCSVEIVRPAASSS